ncbi:MAG: ACT domain-containing protein [Selenomonadaceae bacterium]|nr:ACT domain-containing protein [Selenomonadaceae bacterium]
MSVQQISVFLENKPGMLKKMTAVLKEHDINIRALSVADTKDFGIVRMLVNDVYDATNVLNEAHFITSLKPVLVYAIPDVTGGLDALLEKFDEAKINIDYMYAFAGKTSAYMIFRVNKTSEAEAKLGGKGLESLTEEDVAKV